MAQQNHNWLVTGPWYGVDVLQKDTPPLIQKYDTPQLVNRFLKDPQGFLDFGPEDRVTRFTAPLLKENQKLFDLIDHLKNQVSDPPTATEKQTLDGILEAQKAQFKILPTSLRKLYLDTHRRFYLVVCELRCDAPGLPRVKRDEICRAGFVIRRTRLAPAAPHVGTTLSDDAQQQLRTVLNRYQPALAVVQDAAAALALAQEKLAALGPDATPVERQLAEQEVAQRRSALELASTAFQAAKAEYDAWRSAAMFTESVQGWFPANAQPGDTAAGTKSAGRPYPLEQTGAWRALSALAEVPESSLDGERVYPLYPLIPDPRDPEHAGAGRSIYFAVIPTGSEEKDAQGGPRFDGTDIDLTLGYHIRCFVQRYKPGCPRKRGSECHGPINWSPPSETFKFANQFDPEGTSQNPVNIQVPNLMEMMAQLISDPAAGAGKLASVRLSGGPGSPEFGGDENGKPKGNRISSLPTICFNAIPLITLVALFAFAIFLPIVMFLFNAYWMLLLRFCIPPSLQGLIGDLLGNVQSKIDLFGKSIGFSGGIKLRDLSKLVKLARRRTRRKR